MLLTLNNVASASAEAATAAPSREPERFDVIVVGAGIAGLAAARNLTAEAPELRVLVLDARNRTGGRLHSVETVAGGANRP